MQYESIILFTPVLSEIQLKDTIKEYENILFKFNAKIIYQEHWGLKKLSYTIDNKYSAFYHFFEFKIIPSKIYDFELKLRQDERIIRFIIIKMNKYAIIYSQNKRNLHKEKDKNLDNIDINKKS
ncbi:MAG: 30S ribosomal protein S6 [Candidatus Bostrichicola ureolyticus]|nr:MAG: 30S ribosomal protein S6 [Candidatus Bostrichicola ureolyticus]